MAQKKIHKTVLLDEAVELVEAGKGGTFLDVTMGGGGHTRGLLKANPENSVVALEWDKRVIEVVAPQLEEEFGERVRVVWGNFAHLRRILRKEFGEKKFDGLIADLGTARFHYDKCPGFSFEDEGPLDMRMSQAHAKWSVEEMVNRYPEELLGKIIKEFGEERFWRRIARAIVEYRRKKRIKSAKELADVIYEAVGGLYKKTERRTRTVEIHPATRTFQALRIYANGELDNLDSLLKAIPDVLRSGARAAIITFHSLEDRMVKRAFGGEVAGVRPVTKKPVRPSEREMMDNPASRSAKLRVAEVI